VYFKHKYLTIPTITPADALIKAVDNLVDAISGVIPAELAQRVLRRLAETQRVQTEQELSINDIDDDRKEASV